MAFPTVESGASPVELTTKVNGAGVGVSVAVTVGVGVAVGVGVGVGVGVTVAWAAGAAEEFAAPPLIMTARSKRNAAVAAIAGGAIAGALSIREFIAHPPLLGCRY